MQDEKTKPQFEEVAGGEVFFNAHLGRGEPLDLEKP